MTDLSKEQRRVLDALTLISRHGPVSAHAVAATVSGTEHHTTTCLTELADLGYATRTPDAVYAAWLNRDVDGWEPTDEGRALVVLR